MIHVHVQNETAKCTIFIVDVDINSSALFCSQMQQQPAKEQKTFPIPDLISSTVFSHYIQDGGARRKRKESKPDRTFFHVASVA
jgi:hypothetical protein